MHGFGMLTVGVGVLLMTGFDGSRQHAIGFGVWWFGVLLLADWLLGRDGLPAQLLWAAGVGTGTAVLMSEGGRHWLTEEEGRLLVAAVTLVLAVVLSVALRSRAQRPSP